MEIGEAILIGVVIFVTLIWMKITDCQIDKIESRLTVLETKVK